MHAKKMSLQHPATNQSSQSKLTLNQCEEGSHGSLLQYRSASNGGVRHRLMTDGRALSTANLINTDGTQHRQPSAKTPLVRDRLLQKQQLHPSDMMHAENRRETSPTSSNDRAMQMA